MEENMKHLVLGLLACLAALAHPANAPPTAPSHDSTYAHITIGSNAVAPLLNEQAACNEVADDDASYCALAVLDNVELVIASRGTPTVSAAVGLDLDRVVSKTLRGQLMTVYMSTCADARAAFEDSSCAGRA